jgi:hypothetical protein
VDDGVSTSEQRRAQERLLLERDRRLAGTFPPSRRACESPIAMACFRLLTFFPDRPDFSFPRFISCIALPTLSEAFRPYLRPRDDVFRAMRTS